jgi:NAD(P)-dependent dehydrogenase (short-subunit alcohol dehydrogenase family)
VLAGRVDHRSPYRNRPRHGYLVRKVWQPDHRFRAQEGCQTFERELRSLRADAEFVQADVRHEEDIRRLLDRTVARFGRLDLVAVAGGSDPLRDKYPQ